jgi:hypothetical protein
MGAIGVPAFFVLIFGLLALFRPHMLGLQLTAHRKTIKIVTVAAGVVMVLAVALDPAATSPPPVAAPAPATTTATTAATTTVTPTPTPTTTTVVVAPPPVVTSTVQPTTTTTTPPPPTTTRPSTEYIDKEAHDAHVVVVSYQAVQAGVQILQQGAADPATLASFQQLLSQSKDGFDEAEHSFILASGPKGTGDADREAAAAIREFSDAMSSARSYVDSQKPSDLADYGTHWKRGKAWWNESVSKMWGAVGQPAPTV